jgi:hypothetical protein
MARIDERAIYTILVQGPIDASLADWCGPVTITSTKSADGQLVTTLSGIEMDQAGLMGVTRHLHGLGIILLAIRRELLPVEDAAGRIECEGRYQ